METINVKKYGLKLVMETGYKYVTDIVNSSDRAIDFLKNQLSLHENTEECFCMLCMDSKNNIIGVFEVSRGSLNASLVHPREVFKRAFTCNAHSIIFAHNHPSGDPTPSFEDISVTKRLAEAGEILNVKVLDHIIVGDGESISMKKENLF